MIQGDARNIHFPLSANKGVKQRVMRFTPSFIPKNVKLGVFLFERYNSHVYVSHSRHKFNKVHYQSYNHQNFQSILELAL